jgi:hypothetical protein
VPAHGAPEEGVGSVTEALRCPCGLEITGASAADLIAAAQAHLADEHPHLVGVYDSDDILALSYRRPASTKLAEQ